MSTKDYVIRMTVTALVAIILMILLITGIGLFDVRVDNARLFPILGTLANNASSTLSGVVGAWISFAFGKAAIDRLEEKLKEAQAEIERLRKGTT